MAKEQRTLYGRKSLGSRLQTANQLKETHRPENRTVGENRKETKPKYWKDAIKTTSENTGDDKCGKTKHVFVKCVHWLFRLLWALQNDSLLNNSPLLRLGFLLHKVRGNKFFPQYTIEKIQRDQKEPLMLGVVQHTPSHSSR